MEEMIVYDKNTALKNDDINDEPPSLREIHTYFKENDLYAANFVTFWSYYDSNGWLDRDGKPIKDWKSLAQSWNRYKQKHPDFPESECIPPDG